MCTRYLDAHHIEHWADGGETGMSNLTLTCPYHHRLLHEGGYSIRKGPGGNLQFLDPNGAVIPDVPETRFSGNVSSLHQQNEKLGLEIDFATGLPHSPGRTRTMGWGWAY